MSRWKVDRRKLPYPKGTVIWVACCDGEKRTFPTWREAQDYADRQARTREVVLPRPNLNEDGKIEFDFTEWAGLDYTPDWPTVRPTTAGRGQTNLYSARACGYPANTGVHSPPHSGHSQKWRCLMAQTMTASDVLSAIRRHHASCAVVPEISINDLYSKEQPEGRREVYLRRIDALMFDGGQRTAIEIKVDRHDLLHNETWYKTAPWREVTHRFVYAVPAGLAEFSEIETHYQCGLWWIHPDGKLEVRRKARINKYPEPLPNAVIQRLAYRAAGMPVPEDTALAAPQPDLIDLMKEGKRERG